MNKEELNAQHGQLWDTKQLQEDFTVHGFMAPQVKVTRKSDGIDGLLTFQHRPQWYHSFKPQAHDRSCSIRIGRF